MKDPDLSKTIEQLEGDVWGEPEYNSSLVLTIHALRKKPLRDFTDEDIRINVGQEFSLEILVPVALNRLEVDPLAQGDLYPGDILDAMSRHDVSRLALTKRQTDKLRSILKRAIEMLASDPEKYWDFEGDTARKLEQFLGRLNEQR